jgi:copper(I)-binding protein
MNKRLPIITIGVVALGITAMLAASVLAQAQTIKATNAWARRAPATGGHDTMKMDKPASSDKGTMSGMSGDKGAMAEHGNGAVYVTLSNSGSQPDALVSASTDVAQTTELHQTTSDGGVMKMRPVKEIPVPAGGKTELKPGGYHIMLMGLKHDLKPGEKVAVTLKFEHGGETRVEAPVK